MGRFQVLLNVLILYTMMFLALYFVLCAGTRGTWLLTFINKLFKQNTRPENTGFVFKRLLVHWKPTSEPVVPIHHRATTFHLTEAIIRWLDLILLVKVSLSVWDMKMLYQVIPKSYVIKILPLKTQQWEVFPSGFYRTLNVLLSHQCCSQGNDASVPVLTLL